MHADDFALGADVVVPAGAAAISQETRAVTSEGRTEFL